MLSPVSYFGGKKTLAKWLIANMPHHRQYIEVFGGGAALLFAKQPSTLEVYNDKDWRLVNLMQRIKQEPCHLRQAILAIDPTERAYKRSYRRSYDDSITGSAWLWLKINGSYAYSPMNQGGYRLGHIGNWDRYHNAIDALPLASERLQSVAIHQLDWRELIDAYDSEDSLLYIDPPYPDFMRTELSNYYSSHLTDQEHIELLDRLKRAKAKIMLSTYLVNYVTGAENDLYLDMLSSWKMLGKIKRTRGRLGKHSERLEGLFINKNN